MELPKDIKEKKIDAVGLSYYGQKFTGYQKIGEITELIPAFKDFYYAVRVKDPNARLSTILQDFNAEVCEPVEKKFHPYTTQLRLWRTKWDRDLMQQMHDKDILIIEKRNIHQVIKTRNQERELVLGGPEDGEIEAGLRTLGGELLNDAFQMLRDDQELEEIYDNDELIKRRNYIVNVFGHVTKMAQGKAALMLKASQEKRENASFLMTLIATATSGKMTDEQLDLLKTTYTPPIKVNE